MHMVNYSRLLPSFLSTVMLLMILVSTTLHARSNTKRAMLPVVQAMSITTGTTSASKRTKVAIIGGGIAGLSCAQHLTRHADASNSNLEVTVYDTGRLRPGGRCSTRQVGDRPKEDERFPLLSHFRYDHAAQMIAHHPSSGSADFGRQLKEWVDAGILKEFPPLSVCQIDYGHSQEQQQTTPVVSSESKFYYATEGMGTLAQAMVDTSSSTTAKTTPFDLQQDVWVSPSSGVKYQKANDDDDDDNNSGKWKLQAKGKTLGVYDQLILAHNGKCADRIMSKTPAKDLHQLLKVNFSPTVPEHGGTRMTLNSLYSLTVVLPASSSSPSPLARAFPKPFINGLVTNHPSVRSISCQTRKYPSSSSSSSSSSNTEEYEVWNILSSAKFAKKYKAPQEFLPEEVVEQVSGLLWEAVQDICRREGEEKEATANMKWAAPLEQRVQLWGAGVPLNVWRTSHGCLWDETYQVGVCGDWLVEPSIAGAWTSGRALAQHLLSTNKGRESVGIQDGPFRRSESSNQLGLAALSGVSVSPAEAPASP